MAFATLTSGVVHYRDGGARHAAAIVFVNGLGTDMRIWDAVVERLVGEYRVVTYDKRGHGLSSVPDGRYTIAGLATDLRELADHLGLERFAVAGVSLGGMIAQRFAIDHPERLTSLVLCATASRIGDVAGWNSRIEAVKAGGMAAIADAVSLRWFAESIRDGRGTELAGWRDMLLRSPAAGYVATCAALRDEDLTEKLGGIATPTLVVAGAVDEVTPVDLVRATAERIPGARFEVIQGAGHLPSIDQPETVARLIRSHIQGHDHG